MYPKTSHKESTSPFLWFQIHTALTQSNKPGDSFFLQLAGKSKVRLGFTSHDTAHQWYKAVKFDLDNQGILSKDERTNNHICDIFDASNTESSVSNRSSAGSVVSQQANPDSDTMVLYDVPVWMEDEHVTEAFNSKGKPLHSATKLNWTMGDISMLACKLVGPNVKQLT